MSSLAAADATPSVAKLTTGGFVVVWQSPENAGDIRAQLFTAAGERRGGEFTVSSTTAGTQSYPNVIATPGRFVVAWNDSGSIKSQAFTEAGVKEGAEFTIAFNPLLSEESPEIAEIPGQGYVLAWSLRSADTSRAQFQLVSDLGVATGPIVTATDAAPPGSNRVKVAPVNASGDFALSILRTLDAASNSQTIDFQIRGRDGSLVRAQSGSADPYNISARHGYALTALSTGGFAFAAQPSGSTGPAPILTWTMSGSSVPRGALTGKGNGGISVIGGRIAAAGTSGFFLTAFEAMDADGSIGVSAQLFDNVGLPRGDFRVNTTMTGIQARPDVAFLSNSDVVVTWRDGPSGLIKAQMFRILPAS